MYSLIIVEDDPMVAEINRQFALRNKDVEIIGIFNNPEKALEAVKEQPVDIILLDYYMPHMTGRDFLEKLRAFSRANVVMITAANDSDKITELYSFGVSDFLIKPFEYARFELALSRVVRELNILNSAATLTQEEIDRIVSNRTISEDEPAKIDKNIHEVTLDRVIDYMKTNKDRDMPVNEIADGVGLSRVTVRHYLIHLINRNEVVSTIDYQTGGRPSTLYKYVK